jgi:hypothetical protein
MSFTGSPETDSKIMAACARNLIPLHVELGGKAPQIVLRDANKLARAVPSIVRSITLNTGQVCAAGSRLRMGPSRSWTTPSSKRSSSTPPTSPRPASRGAVEVRARGCGMDDNPGLDQRSNKPVTCCLSSSGTRVMLCPAQKGRSLPS